MSEILKIRYIFSLLCVLAFGICQAQRRVNTINEVWRFYKGNADGAEAASFDDRQWETVNLPHSWNAEDAFKVNYYKGVGWYRKKLNGPFVKGENYFLYFEGVNQEAEIYVNGKQATVHKGGYSAFSADISSLLHYGKDAVNILSVKADNSPNEMIAPLAGDFTFWGGIYRDVYLIKTGRIHFSMNDYGSFGVYVETPQADSSSAAVKIHGSINGIRASDKGLRIKLSISDAGGKLIAASDAGIENTKEGIAGFSSIIKNIRQPHLWSPDDPYLYQVTAQITDRKGNVFDEVINPLGFRWFSADVRNGFMLNGKPLRLLGASRHQDYPGRGNALSNDLNERDVRLLKEMGANFIRIAHYPQDPSVLDACDKLGLIVWEEIPVVGRVTPGEEFLNNCKTNLKEMIRQHYNHPSVVFWGYSNEVMIDSRKEDKENGYYEHLVSDMKELDMLARSEDPSRITSMAFHGSEIYNQYGLGEIPATVGWNRYDGWYGGGLEGFAAFIDEQHAKYPGRVLFISEYGAGSDKRLHSLKPERFDFSSEYQQLYHEYYLPEIMKRQFIIGSAIWNLIDFGVAWRQESMPRINNKGMLYQNRDPKDVYFFYQAAFSKKPVLHIAARDWNNRTGAPVNASDAFVKQPVKIYTNLQEAELFLNGKSLGEQRSVNNKVVFEVPFTDGRNILEARGRETEIRDELSVYFKVQPYNLATAGKDLMIAVNAGSDCFYEEPKSHLIFQPDQPYREGNWGYTGGNQYRPDQGRPGIQSEITATDDDPLFQTLREDMTAYRFDVPDGTYQVELYFCEPKNAGQQRSLYDLGAKQTAESGVRIFDVLINNQKVLPAYNIMSKEQPLTAIIKSYVIKAEKDAGIRIVFNKLEGKPLINAIKISRRN